jgi:CheY-like chemotaxis protein
VSHTVLVVDDDDNLRETICDMLESEGYKALAAGNGLEALTILRQNEAPCLILLDLMMPVMNGWEFLEEQVKDPLLAAIPVVVLSASHDSAGPAVVWKITKPVDFKTLAQVVGKYC